MARKLKKEIRGNETKKVRGGNEKNGEVAIKLKS